MKNEELLVKIREIVRSEVTAETGPINKRLDNLETGQSTITKRLGSLEARQAGLETYIQTIKADIDHLTKDAADFFQETWKKMATQGEIDKVAERVTIIEDHLELKHPSKN